MTLAIACDTVNRKVGAGRVCVTHAAQGSCPLDCPFLDSGCYAESGPQMFVTRRLNAAARDATPLEIAMAEAEAIDGFTKVREAMRIHIVGDCVTDEAASIVSSAACRWSYRSNGAPVWAYTHAWRNVERLSWGNVSVLASVENDSDAELAMSLGYAAAKVVAKGHAAFTDGKARKIDGRTEIPCPAQTRESVTCADCKLCWNASALLKRKAVIMFEAHGAHKKVGKALEGVSDEA